MNATASGAAGIELQAVTKRYDGARDDLPPAVDAISLVVPRGTLTTLLGPSGCGKTTTLRMIAGLESPSSGRILLDGVDVTASSASQRNVGMVFQSYALFPHLDVLGNVGYGLRVAGVPRAQVAERARAAMASVGLEGLEARLPAELSGGQQQRVALARALVLEPAMLLFDEPLSNLDAALRRAMRDEIRSLQRRLGLTVAYVTHDQSEAMAISDEVIVMRGGRIAQRGSPRALYERPADAFVARFMGEATVLQGERLADGRIRLGPLVAAVPGDAYPAAGPVSVAIRPHAWRIAGAAEGAAASVGAGASDPSGSGEALAGTVIHAAYLGHAVEYRIDTALGEIFTSAAVGAIIHAPGAPVRLKLDPAAIAVLPTAT